MKKDQSGSAVNDTHSVVEENKPLRKPGAPLGSIIPPRGLHQAIADIARPIGRQKKFPQPTLSPHPTCLIHSELPVRMVADMVLHDYLFKEGDGFLPDVCAKMWLGGIAPRIEHEQKAFTAQRTLDGLFNLRVAFLNQRNGPEYDACLHRDWRQLLCVLQPELLLL